MHTYRRIEREPEWPPLVWSIEEAFPEWFRDASHAWTPDYAGFLAFWAKCREIWGLFEGDRLTAIVYLEFPYPEEINIHVSVLRKSSEIVIVNFFKSLTRQKTLDGVTRKKAWILKHNRPLLAIAAKAGYHPTGLVMDYGSSKGRLLRWVEVQG